MTSSHPASLNATRAAIALPAIVTGFATAVAMWVVWVVAHHPAINLPPAVIGPVLLLLQIGSVAWWIRRVAASQLKVGSLSGIVMGTINSLLLGGMIAKQFGATAAPGLEGLPHNAPLVIGLFILGSGVLGGVGGAIGSAMGPTPGAGDDTRSCWLARFAVVAAVAVVPLLTLGGAVTSANAGLSVPDWPGTYGANMFLYPIGLMAADPRVFLEHTHRLFGSLVGLTTVVLFVATLIVDRRTWIKVFAGVLVLAVIAQGVVGGIWVLMAQESGMDPRLARWLPVFHGVMAQVYFAGAVAFAAATSLAFAQVAPNPHNALIKGPAKWTKILLGVLLVQLVMGAMYRHLQSKHALFTHIGVALVVVALAQVVGFRMKKLAREGVSASRQLEVSGTGVAHTAGLQFLLGWLAFLVVGTAAARVNPTADQLTTTDVVSGWYALVRSAHQVNGAALIALATLAAVWAGRVASKAANQGANGPMEPKSTSVTTAT